MPASHVRLEVQDGLADLYCPACGAPVFTDAAGPAEDLCDHVCFFIDWQGEIMLASPDNYAGEDQRRQQAIVDLIEETEDWDEFIGKVVKTLAPSAVVLDIEGAPDEDGEPSRAQLKHDTSTSTDGSVNGKKCGRRRTSRSLPNTSRANPSSVPLRCARLSPRSTASPSICVNIAVWVASGVSLR